MWTDSTDGYQLVKELTRAIVTEVAPEEIPLFDDLIQEYFHNPEEPEFAKRPRDEALGSGLEQILPAVTPATAAMVSIILTYLANEVLKLSGTITSEIIKEKIKSKFLGPKDSAFTAEQFDIIRRLARKQAKAFGMDDSTAKRMAEALIGSLASLPAGKKH